MFFRSLLFLSIIGFAFTSCKDSNPNKEQELNPFIELHSDTDHPPFVSNMEVAHKKTKLLENGMVCFNLDMTFGKSSSTMKIFTTPTSSAIRVDKKEGASTVVLDGKIFTDAEEQRWDGERFGVYTYQYFFMAPYKFSDEGTIWTRLPDMELEGKITNRAKLTFESGTGDAPDDWYIVHSDPETNRVEYIAYIVTAGGTTVEEAEKSIRIIKYSDYDVVDGVPFAFKWEFFNYSFEDGLGDKVGEGILKNVEMMDVVDQFDIIHDGTYSEITS
ncbi:MAG: hypothetical protein AAGA77_11120 [Bacteroidota bacterium]